MGTQHPSHSPGATNKSSGKRQVAKLSKRQLGMEIGRNILNHLSQMAANVSEVVDKGKDPQTGAPLRCSPDDIRRYWTPEQSAAIDEFMANFHIEPEQPSRPPPPEGRSKKAKGRS